MEERDLSSVKLYRAYLFNGKRKIPRQTLHSRAKRSRQGVMEIDNHGNSGSSLAIQPANYHGGHLSPQTPPREEEGHVEIPFPVEDGFDHFPNLQNNVNFKDFESATEPAEKEDGESIYPNSRIKSNEAVLLIFAFIVRHVLTEAAVDDLLTLISSLLPLGSLIPKSRHHLKKSIDCDYSVSKTNFYCTSCERALDEEGLRCNWCKVAYTKQNLLSSNSFFLSFPIETVLKEKLGFEAVGNSVLQTLSSRVRNDVPVLRDIWDGQAYKQLELGSTDITCSSNSDGIPAFKSSNFSIYPLLLSINEASLPIRKKYTITAAMWFGKGKPKFTTFFKPFIKDAKELAKTGFSWEVGGKIINSRVYFPLFVTDSVARCVVQGMVQFNGEYGCPWCYERGKLFPLPNKKYKRVYPPVSENALCPRDHKQSLEDLTILSRTLRSGKNIPAYRGFKSSSPLLGLPKFDVINGFTFDVMHTSLLGVTRQLMTLWFESKYNRMDYYLGKKINEVDRTFLSTYCPTEVPRAARSIRQRKFWKSSEWKVWLLISPSFLDKFLPQKYFKHFCLFAESMVLLSSEQVSLSDIESAEKSLFKFVSQFPRLYGEGNCSSNTHLLLHAANCVRNWGPLQCYSAFQYESFNQVILKSFHGSRLIAKQICNKVCERMSVHKHEKITRISGFGSAFYNQLMYGRKGPMNLQKIGNVKVVGSGRSFTLRNELRSRALEMGINGPFRSFNSCLVNGLRFDIKQNTKRNNSFVSYNKSLFKLCNIITSSNPTRCIGIGKKLVVKERFRNMFLVKGISNVYTLFGMDRIDVVKLLSLKNGSNLHTVVRLPHIAIGE